MCNMWFRCIEFIGTRGGKTGQLKRGHYVNSRGICNDCMQSNETKDGDKEEAIMIVI